jgi:transcriptional regulator with XRE-family HTH domain
MTTNDLIGLRARLCWSQEHLARELGVSRSTVARWESGQRPIPPMAAMALSWLLVNMELVLDEPGPPSPGA